MAIIVPSLVLAFMSALSGDAGLSIATDEARCKAAAAAAETFGREGRLPAATAYLHQSTQSHPRQSAHDAS